MCLLRVVGDAPILTPHVLRRQARAKAVARPDPSGLAAVNVLGHGLQLNLWGIVAWFSSLRTGRIDASGSAPCFRSQFLHLD